MPRAVPVPPKAAMTDAEKITNARESIKQASSALEKLQARLTDPESEYVKAETEFEDLNMKLKMLKLAITKLRADGKEDAAKTQEALAETMQEDWQLAKERFDNAILQKKATQETITGLAERIAADQQLLNQLEGKSAPPASKAPAAVAQPAPTAKPDTTTKPVAAAKPTISPAALMGLPSVPELPGEKTEPTAATATIAVPTNAADNDPVVMAARDVLDRHRVALADAEARLRVAEERDRVMERAIVNATNMQHLEQVAVAQAEKSLARLTTTLQTQPMTDWKERENLATKQTETEQRLVDARERVERIGERITSFQDNLKNLRAEHDVVAKEVEIKQKQVTDAQDQLTALLSPTAPRNLFRWLLAKGPRLLMILVGMGLTHLAARQFSRHIVAFITRNSQRGSPEDRQNRASTLVGVFRYAAGIVVFGGGAVMILDEIGVPIVPLMGGAAVLGLAVAFGAQNLIRDYFTGFMMLMEDQYSINDVVRIGSIAGLVELITLRMTVLRDLEGVRHFIPHGTVTSVSNLTHGWSRAMMDVSVAYKENVDQVITVLMQLGREMRRDPVLGRHILEDPEMLGVDSLADSGVTIKFLLKTRPLQQWPVKREMLRRIKNRFDELGIEIPFPHQTVYHHFPDQPQTGVDHLLAQRHSA